MRWSPTSRVIAPWREWDLQIARATDRVRRAAPDPDRQGQARRGAVLGRRQPAALLVARARCWRTRRSEAPDYVYSRTIDPEEAPDKATIITHRLRAGRCGRDRRQEAVAGDAADAAQRARPRQRHRPARSGREPLRRHEVARHVRDARRHHPACRASRHRIDHARSRRGAPEGRADAEICRADLQRLLVLAGARDAAGGDRPEPAICHRPGAAEALQGQRRS